jgi:predicted O-methyltransferase YrrM
VIRARCADAADQPEPLDWAYVYGDHTYEAVNSDLENFCSLLKPGGVLAGDDYAMAGWREDGATRAAEQSVAAHDLEATILGNQLVLTKPR